MELKVLAAAGKPARGKGPAIAAPLMRHLKGKPSGRENSSARI